MDNIECISENIEIVKKDLINLDFLMPDLSEETFLQEKIIKKLCDTGLNNIAKALNMENILSELDVDSIIYRISDLFNQLQFEQNIDVSAIGLQTDEKLKICLLFLVKASAKELFDFTSIEKIAAKSITILNAARISFSGMDLSSIRISEANLSYGVFDKTNFENAELNQVKFHSAWLRQANFRKAQMIGVVFGELPFLSLKYEELARPSCCYSPNGYLLAVSDGNDVILYDAHNLSLIHQFQGHTKAVTDITFSLDGRMLASTSWDKTLRLWSTTLLKELHVFRGYGDSISPVAFSPNGQLLASAGEATLYLWSMVDRKLLHLFRENIGSINCLAFSPNGEFLALGCANNLLRIWSVSKSKLLHTVKLIDSIVSISFSPDGRFLASAIEDLNSPHNDIPRIQLWSVPQLELRHNLENHGSRGINYITFSSNGKLLAGASPDKTVRLWSVSDLKLLKVYEGHAMSVDTVQFSPEGDILVSASLDRTVRFWLVDDNNLRISEGHTNEVFTVAFAANKRILATGSQDGTIKFWSILDGRLLRTLEGHICGINSVVFSPDGKLLASASGNLYGGKKQDNCLCLWSMDDEKVLHVFEKQPECIRKVDFSPDGELLAFAGYDCIVYLYAASDWKLLERFKGHEHPIVSLAFSKDGGFLVSGSMDNTLRLWWVRANIGHQKYHKLPSPIFSIAVPPERGGRFLAIGCGSKTINIYVANFLDLLESNNSKKWYTLKGHTNTVMDLDFTPDGKYLASSSFDATVRIWSMKNRICLFILNGVSFPLDALRWMKTPENLYLATGSKDAAVRLWQVVVEENTDSVKANLLWTTRQSVLTISEARIDESYGLNNIDQLLLKQRGALGDPIKTKEENESLNVNFIALNLKNWSDSLAKLEELKNKQSHYKTGLSYQNDRIEKANMLTILGAYHIIFENVEEAKECFLLALTIQEEFESENLYDLKTILSWLAFAYAESNDFLIAKEFSDRIISLNELSNGERLPVRICSSSFLEILDFLINKIIAYKVNAELIKAYYLSHYLQTILMNTHVAQHIYSKRVSNLLEICFKDLFEGFKNILNYYQVYNTMTSPIQSEANAHSNSSAILNQFSSFNSQQLIQENLNESRKELKLNQDGTILSSSRPTQDL